MRYFLLGFMGSGKTFWANEWGNSFGIPVFDLDATIEASEHKSISDLFKEKGEDAFRKMEKKILHSFFAKDNFILSCGGGTPCFYDNIKQMNKNGVTIYLKSTPQQLASRLKTEKDSRPLIKDVPDEMLEQFISQKLSNREPWYNMAMYHLHTEFLSNANFERIKFRHEK
jgi:shikimate kinase